MKNKQLLWFIAIVLIGVLVVWFVLLKPGPMPKVKGYDVSVELAERPLDIVFGNDSAHLAVFVYSNYQCTYCRKFFNDVFPLLKADYLKNNKVKIIMRIVANTNSLDLQRALNACVCVNKYGNYQYIHNLLLHDYRVMYTPQFQDIINEFIEKNSFIGECIDGENANDYYSEINQEFEALNLKGTPGFVIEDKAYRGFRSYKALKNIIETHLNNL